MSFLITAVAFVVIFSLLILIHEFGHFYFARRAKIKVDEFGFGLPPRIWGVKKKGTLWSINAIPMGGFVRMRGEDDHTGKASKDPGSFANKSIWQRVQVVVAGVMMNFLLAWFLLTISFSVGVAPFIVNEADFNQAVAQGLVKTSVGIGVFEVAKDSIAEKAGFKKDDIILKINNQRITKPEEVSDILKKQAGNTISFSVKREKDMLEFFAIPDKSDGRIGISISSAHVIEDIRKIRYPWFVAPLVAFKETGRLAIATVGLFGDLLRQVVRFNLPENVSGPIGIVQMTHTYVKLGFAELLKFTALLSLSLGVINIMPLPALDGGRLLFLFVEFIRRGKGISPKLEAKIHGIGFMFLMLLILAVTWQDILRLFR